MVVRECREDYDLGSIFGNTDDIFKGFDDIFGRKK